MAFLLSHARTEGAKQAATLRELVTALKAPYSFDVTNGTIAQCLEALNDLGPFDLELSREQLDSLSIGAVGLILRGKGATPDSTLTKKKLIDEILGEGSSDEHSSIEVVLHPSEEQSRAFDQEDEDREIGE